MNISISNALEKYLHECQGDVKNDKTIRTYQDTLHDFLNFIGDISVETLNLEHLQRYIADVYTRQDKCGEFSASSVHKYYAVVHAFIHWMYTHDYIDKPINLVMALPQLTTDRLDFLTEHEFNGLLDYLKNKGDFRDLVIFEVFLETGLRVHELISLNLEDVNLEARTLTIKSKNGKEAFVPFGNTLTRDLSTYIQEYRICDRSETALFISRSGNRFRMESLNMLIKRTLHNIRERGKCGGDTLRNTFAITFLKNGGKDITLHAILRNTDFRITRRYVVALSNEMEEVINVPELENLSE